MSAKTETRYSLEVETVIKAELATVWDLLVNPVKTSQLFWGSTVESDFKVGSPISWKGTWEGKPFEDRGVIKRVQHTALLQYTHWSTATGSSEDEGSHNLLTFRLSQVKDGVRVVFQHENIATLELKEHSEPMWKMLLETLKKMAEAGSAG
jgi:uncharacterized protein YndB with AHSA1/START domain